MEEIEEKKKSRKRYIAKKSTNKDPIPVIIGSGTTIGVNSLANRQETENLTKVIATFMESDVKIDILDFTDKHGTKLSMTIRKDSDEEVLKELEERKRNLKELKKREKDADIVTEDALNSSREWDETSFKWIGLIAGIIIFIASISYYVL